MHFCGGRIGRRPNLEVPVEFRNMSGPDRLTRILWEQQLRTFVPFSGADRVVCFTEAMQPGLEFMIRQQGYGPWGVAFEKQSVYNLGGGPVWYPRTEQHKILQLDHRLRSWAVPLEAPGNDWRWEREWRIVRSSPPAVALTELRLACLLVGDPWWNGVLYETRVAADTGQPRQDYFFPPIPPGLPRYWWNGTHIQLLSPLF
jgi:hypothetical protein